MKEKKQTDPKGAKKGKSRVYRGGYAYDQAVNCRSANRYRNAPAGVGSSVS